MRNTFCTIALASTLVATSVSADVMIGAYLPGDGWSRTRISNFNTAAVKDLAFVNVFSGFSYSWNHLYWQSSNIFAEGAMPLISWMPIDSSRYHTNILPEIIGGQWDAYIDLWGTRLKNWAEGYPVGTQPTVLLRFGHEFNGTWYSYGDDPVNFQDAWRYIHDRFATIGANQHIEWVWSANYVNVDNHNDMTLYYPGDTYVDWTSLDGYNWGTNYSWTSWKSFSTVFANSYNTLVTNYPSKPILIGEVASTEETDYPDPNKGQYGDDSDINESKALWVTDMMAELETSFPAIRAISLFNKNKELNWSMSEVTNTGLSEYNVGLADSYFTDDFLSASDHGGSASLQLPDDYQRFGLQGPSTLIADASTYTLPAYQAADVMQLFDDERGTGAIRITQVAQASGKLKLDTMEKKQKSNDSPASLSTTKAKKEKRNISKWTQQLLADSARPQGMDETTYQQERYGFMFMSEHQQTSFNAQRLESLGTAMRNERNGKKYLAAVGIVSTDGYHYCAGDVVDSDGDGYAVMDGEPCVISGSQAEMTPSCDAKTQKDNSRVPFCLSVATCSYQHNDQDGDGFAKESGRLCKM